MDFSHLQQLIQTSAAGFAPDVTPHPVTVTLTDSTDSPAVFPFTEVIDLSTSANEQCPAVSGEKTPGTYGEVPGFLLDIARGGSTGTCPKTSAHSHNRAGSTARVCLEKRFKILSNYHDIRYGTPGKHILLVTKPYLNLYRGLGFWQSTSSLRRGSFSLRISPGSTLTGQIFLRFPAHLSWVFSTRSPTCATRYVGRKQNRKPRRHFCFFFCFFFGIVRLLSIADDRPASSRS